MKKIVIDRPGGYCRLQVKELPMPDPRGNEVLVEVSAAGVNFADVFVRLGLYKSGREYVGWPITPGFEYAGKIVKCGAGVSDFAEDTPVFGVTRFGAYASHLCVPQHLVFPIPPNSKFTCDQWAAFPAVYLTAYHGLFHNLVVRPNMNILVHSAAGGVGGALLQLGKIAECRMIAVVGSSHKIDTALALGADAVIDKSREDLWAKAEEICPDGFDVVFDANGPSTLKQSYRHLAPGGKLVSYGFHSLLSTRRGIPNYVKLLYEYFRVPRFNPLNLTADNKSVIAFNLSYLFHQTERFNDAIINLCRWIEDGKIKAPPLKFYPFEKVADAHRALESGQTIGKLVLKFSG